MRHAPLGVVILAFASFVASANTTKVERTDVARKPPASPAARDASAAGAAACYALDTVARHECIYAAVVRSRASKDDALN